MTRLSSVEAGILAGIDVFELAAVGMVVISSNQRFSTPPVSMHAMCGTTAYSCHRACHEGPAEEAILDCTPPSAYDVEGLRG